MSDIEDFGSECELSDGYNPPPFKSKGRDNTRCKGDDQPEGNEGTNQPQNREDELEEDEETDPQNREDELEEDEETDPKNREDEHEEDEETDPKNREDEHEEHVGTEPQKDDNSTDQDVTDEETEDIAEAFSFKLTAEQWSTLTVVTDRKGQRHLERGWTDEFYDEIRKINPKCPLVFKYNHIPKTVKKHGTFFRAKANCKFRGCIRYLITIKKTPKEGKSVKVKVTPEDEFKVIKHDGKWKARFIKGDKRIKLAQALKEKGVSNTYYKKLAELEKEALQARNATGFGSKDVLQKISSEAGLVQRLHKDVIVEVALLKKVYEKKDHTEGTIKGYIQSISFMPFAAVMYSARQLDILAQAISSGKGILYFDATGQVVQKIPSQEKRVFYYALVLKGHHKDPPVAVAELLSNSHTTLDISNFLMKLQRDFHLRHPSLGVPMRIEIEFSWAFIHSILLAFNHEELSMYLRRAWDVLHLKDEWGEKTKIHICSAHLLHKMAGRLTEFLKEKTSKQYVMYTIARIVDQSNMDVIDKQFRNLCIILLSESVDSHPNYAEALHELDALIKSPLDTHIPIDIENVDVELDEEGIHGQKPSTSAFGHHYTKLMEEVRSQMKTTGKSDKNVYFSPDALKYLLSRYMGIIPLWTGVLLEDVSHDTNSPVENWFKIVKHNVLEDRSMRPGDFIIEMEETLNGRVLEYELREDEISMEERKGKQKVKRGKRKSFATSEEKWDKKKKKGKGMYFRSPEKVLRKEHIRKRPKETLGETSLHWGGKVRIDNRTITMTNTCPVDNLLVLTFFLLKRSFVKEWFEKHSEAIEVCSVLLDVWNLFQSGNWDDGRALWINRYCTPPQEDTWDMYGSESVLFVKHFGGVQETSITSTCSRRRCPRRERNMTSQEILLGNQKQDDTTELDPTEILQESIKQWEVESSSKCRTGRCRGDVTWTRRRFVHDDPPVLVVCVGGSLRLTPPSLPDTVDVLGERYNLFAYTLGTGSHFKAYFRYKDTWNRYDGLLRPEVMPVPQRGEDGQLEHVVLVKE